MRLSLEEYSICYSSTHYNGLKVQYPLDIKPLHSFMLLYKLLLQTHLSKWKFQKRLPLQATCAVLKPVLSYTYPGIFRRVVHSSIDDTERIHWYYQQIIKYFFFEKRRNYIYFILLRVSKDRKQSSDQCAQNAGEVTSLDKLARGKIDLFVSSTSLRHYFKKYPGIPQIV